MEDARNVNGLDPVRYQDNNSLGIGPWIVQECGRGKQSHIECKTEMEAKAYAKALCAKRGVIVAVCQVRFVYERLAVTEHVVLDTNTEGGAA